MSAEITLEFDQNDLLPLLYGEHNGHLHYIEKKLSVIIADRGNVLVISGAKDAIKDAETVILSLWERLKASHDVGTAEIDAALRFLRDDQKNASVSSPSSSKRKTKKKASSMSKSDGKVIIKTKKKSISPRSPNQQAYLKLIKEKEMVFGLGSAGTGKTYLAVAMGVSMFLNGEVERLIFTRPAVEAGENLGFLPGDMKDKVDPYLRPIYDAMQDMMPWDFVVGKMDSGEIEIAPLAFMRGRTLNNAFVILDEAQNATPTQMKMFLTRMGEAAHMVITGDLTQTDLPRGMKSGLRDAVELLEHNIKDIGFIRFSQEDVVRHHLVAKIVAAYDARKKSEDETR